MAEDQEFTLPPLEERPLVTFALFAYNQEKYIREAVEGAFAQTYEPLEIILSDDCSTDRTFEIMVEMAGEYRGPHKIILNRNKKNMNISPHVRFVHENMCSGDIIVHAAGDDISRPERTVSIVRAFLYSGFDPSVVMSNSNLVNKDGAVVGLKNKALKTVFKLNKECPLNFSCPGGGATLALKRTLIHSFQAPNKNIFIEDNMLLVRAHMMKGVLYIPDVLVNYRIDHGSATSPFGGKLATGRMMIDNHIKWNQDRIYGVDQFFTDMRFINYNSVSSKCLRAVNRYYGSLKSIKSILTGSFLISFLALLREATRVNRSDYRIYIPISYKTPFKLFLIRWCPIVLGVKRFYVGFRLF